MQYVDIYTGCTTRMHAVDVSRVWNSGTAPLGWGKRAAGDEEKIWRRRREKKIFISAFLAKLATILWELDAIPVPN